MRNADPVCSEMLRGVKEAGAKRQLVLFVGAKGKPYSVAAGPSLWMRLSMNLSREFVNVWTLLAKPEL